MRPVSSLLSPWQEDCVETRSHALQQQAAAEQIVQQFQHSIHSQCPFHLGFIGKLLLLQGSQPDLQDLRECHVAPKGHWVQR